MKKYFTYRKGGYFWTPLVDFYWGIYGDGHRLQITTRFGTINIF